MHRLVKSGARVSEAAFFDDFARVRPGRRAHLQGWAAVLMSMAGSVVIAQPQRPNTALSPLKIVVPFAPGGGNDVFARQLAKGLSDLRGAPVFVENKAGAGGNLGTAEVIRSAADGLTLLLGHTGTVSINPALFKGLKHDARTDLQAVAMLAQSALVLVVPASSPVTSLSALIAAARAQPGTWNFASSGSGTGGHLAGEQFQQVTGLSMRHIPYKGTAPALADVAGAQVQMSFSVLPPALALIRAGKLRPLAVTSARRLPGLPEVPTVAESGVPGLSAFESVLTYGVLAPVATPAKLVQELSEQILRVASAPEFQARLETEGALPTPGSAETYGRLIRAENLKWADIVRRSGATVE